MSENKSSQSSQAQENTQLDPNQVKIHVSPDLDYNYRDIVNIYVGNGDVVMEFGNLHRSMPGHVTISNRMVLTTAAAFELQAQLQNVLVQAQQQMQMQMQQQMQQKS